MIKIKEFRQRLHLKQKDLAKQLGILPTTLYKYEKEIIQPSNEMLISISKQLGVSVDALLGTESNLMDLNLLSADQKEMLNLILEFSPSTQNIALGYLRILKAERENKKTDY